MLYGTVVGTFYNTEVLPTKSADIAYHCRIIKNAREIKKKWSDNLESGMLPRVMLWKI
jgi:hypothetical protein